MVTQTDGETSHQPTVKEVAALAGVSPMTASRTIAGGTNVRPELQDRVLEAVRALGYRRNENARRMRAGEPSGLVGVAITNLGNPYYGNFALGVEEIAATHGRRIVLGNTAEDTQRERRLIADLIGRQVEGLILVPTGQEAAHLQHGLGDTPLVLASRTVPGVDVDTVVLDDVGGAYRGTRVLLDGGHRRIAFLGNVTSVFTGRRRYAGFTRALAEFDLVPDATLVKRDQQDVETARRAMSDLLDLADAPTAIFCANNRNTIGALKEIGARIRASNPASGLPAIVSFDDFELAEMMPVPVTVVDHDPRELGREAARLLFTRLAGDRFAGPPRHVELPTRIRVARP